MLQSMRSQRVGHDWAIEQQQQQQNHLLFFALQKKLESKPREDGSLEHKSTIFLIWLLSE